MNRYTPDDDGGMYPDRCGNFVEYELSRELLEALEQCVTSMLDSGYSNNHVSVIAAKSAIAKAKGEL